MIYLAHSPLGMCKLVVMVLGEFLTTCLRVFQVIHNLKAQGHFCNYKKMVLLELFGLKHERLNDDVWVPLFF